MVDAAPGVALVVSEAAPVIEMLPLATPAAFGAKTMLTGVLWPGDRVTGSASPLRLKPALLAAA